MYASTSTQGCQHHMVYRLLVDPSFGCNDHDEQTIVMSTFRHECNVRPYPQFDSFDLLNPVIARDAFRIHREEHDEPSDDDD